MKIVVFGLQRSGTNFIESFLRENLHDVIIVNTDSRYIWKHEENIDLERIDRNNGHILITKSPYNWIESILRKPVDIKRRRQYLSENDKTKISINGFDIEELASLWNKYMKNFYNEDYIKKINYEKVRYEDIIESKENHVLFLEKISHRFNLSRKYDKDKLDSVNLPKKVSQSEEWNEQRRIDFLNEKLTNLTWESIQLINQHLEEETLFLSGYKRINNKEEYERKKQC